MVDDILSAWDNYAKKMKGWKQWDGKNALKLMGGKCKVTKGKQSMNLLAISYNMKVDMKSPTFSACIG